MLIIGLTGSIGMGKSTAAARFEANGVPVFDADAEVHRLYEGEAAPAIERAFPGVAAAGRVDRAKLSAALMAAPERFPELEAIVHPLVRAGERDFLLKQERAGRDMAVLEIPLLFETGAEEWVDKTLVVTAPAAVQRKRVLARPGMSKDKLDALLAHQLSDMDKRARADFIVDTSGAIEDTGAEIDRLIESLRGQKGQALARWKALH